MTSAHGHRDTMLSQGAPETGQGQAAKHDVPESGWQGWLSLSHLCLSVRQALPRAQIRLHYYFASWDPGPQGTWWQVMVAGDC